MIPHHRRGSSFGKRTDAIFRCLPLNSKPSSIPVRDQRPLRARAVPGKVPRVISRDSFAGTLRGMRCRARRAEDALWRVLFCDATIISDPTHGEMRMEHHFVFARHKHRTESPPEKRKRHRVCRGTSPPGRRGPERAYGMVALHTVTLTDT